MARHLSLDTLPGENRHGGLVRAGRCGGAAPAQGRAEGPDAQNCSGQWSVIGGQLVVEGGGDVGDDVVGVFGADCEADEAVRDADCGALGGGEGAVGGVAGVEDE